MQCRSFAPRCLWLGREWWHTMTFWLRWLDVRVPAITTIQVMKVLNESFSVRRCEKGEQGQASFPTWGWCTLMFGKVTRLPSSVEHDQAFELAASSLRQACEGFGCFHLTGTAALLSEDLIDEAIVSTQRCFARDRCELDVVTQFTVGSVMIFVNQMWSDSS